jgi:two-component system, NtrC family, response regulator HydG
VRELRNRLEAALCLSADVAQLSAHDIFSEEPLLDRPAERVMSLAEARERAERLQIEEAMRQTADEIGRAAALLGISRTTLWDKMRTLGL